jgi:hypothetical protein
LSNDNQRLTEILSAHKALKMCAGILDAFHAVFLVFNLAVANPGRDQVEEFLPSIFVIIDHESFHDGALDNRRRKIVTLAFLCVVILTDQSAQNDGSVIF